jgi:hypothetical protein
MANTVGREGTGKACLIVAVIALDQLPEHG